MPITGTAMGRYGSQSIDKPEAWGNVLVGVPLFSALNQRQLRKVAGTAQLKRYHDATIIMKAGDAGDSLHILIDGTVTVRRRGLPPVVREQGSFFGEIALLDGGPRTATVLANGPVTTLVISRSRLLKLLRDQPAIAIAMLEELARRLRSTEVS